jgi:hypothetical protein
MSSPTGNLVPSSNPAQLRAKARRGIRGGLIALIVGVVVVAIGFTSPTGRQAGPRAEDTRVRTIVVGFFITVSGLAGLVQGLRAQGQARRFTSP